MYQIKLEPDLSASIRAAGSQVPFATALALTRTAQASQRELRNEMMRVFDQPTAYTLNSTRVRTATKESLWSAVYLKTDAGKGTPADKYLDPQIKGGPRRLKRFERALGHRGDSGIASGKFAVPGTGARLNRSGNMSPGQIVQILSALGVAETKAGYSANRTARSSKRSGGKQPQFFLGKAGKGRNTLAVWERHGPGGRSIKPVLVMVRPPQYRQRLLFDDVVTRTVEREYGREFVAALTHAFRTAK